MLGIGGGAFRAMDQGEDKDTIKYVYMNDIIATYVTHRNILTSIYQCMLQDVSYLSPAFIWGGSPQGQVNTAVSISIVGGQGAGQDGCVFCCEWSLRERRKTSLPVNITAMFYENHTKDYAVTSMDCDMCILLISRRGIPLWTMSSSSSS